MQADRAEQLQVDDEQIERAETQLCRRRRRHPASALHLNGSILSADHPSAAVISQLGIL